MVLQRALDHEFGWLSHDIFPHRSITLAVLYDLLRKNGELNTFEYLAFFGLDGVSLSTARNRIFFLTETYFHLEFYFLLHG